MRVLAVGAHPDDIEILCAGTLARYAQRGDTVIMAVATNGEQGHSVITPPELAKIREQEARRSAQIIGAELIWMNLPDQFVADDVQTKLLFVEMIRQARPDVVITHFPHCYIMDHRRVASLVFESTFLASVPHVETQSPAHSKVPPLYYMDTLAGLGFNPEEFVDISGTFEIKREMLSQHQSQLKWLKEHDNIDILEFMTVAARFRGIQAGVTYAEAFVKLQAWPRGLTQRVLP